MEDTAEANPMPAELLKTATYIPAAPAPPPLKDEAPPSHLKRVGRPLRHVKYIPTKQLVFYSKSKEPKFTYDIKFKLPVKANNLIVQVKSVGLNPVDLKIINAYTSNFNYERGIGREYAGVVTHVGDNYKTTWHEGDEVCGLYFHPNSYGTLSSSITVDPAVDAIISKPKNIGFDAAGSWMYTFGTAWQILASTKLTQDSSILINGGSSSVGLMCIQLAKQYYKVDNIAVICSGSARDLCKSVGAKVAINYKVNPDLPKVLTVLTTTGVYKDFDDQGNPIEVREMPASHKFDLIVDCVGGYDLIPKLYDYMKTSLQGGQYISTVGDYKSDYATDVYNHWNNPAMNVRKVFGILWNVNYKPFVFSKKYGDWMKIGSDLLESGEIRNVIDSVYDWKEYTAAANKLRKGHCHGKIVLRVEDF